MSLASLIIHVTAAAILFGPQVLMFYAVVPAARTVQDEVAHRALTKFVASRFARLASVAIAVLLATGLYQYYTVVPEHIRNQPNDYRFGLIFAAKMGMLTVLLLLIVVHGVFFGRRIGALSNAVIAGDESKRAELAAVRRTSAALSALILIVTLVTLWLGVALGRESFSYVAR